MREQSKKSVKTRLLALVLVFCMTLQMTSYSPGNVARAEGEGADTVVSEEALTEEGLPESIPSPETTEIIEEAPADVPEKEPAQPTDWTGQNDKLKLTLAELSYQKGDETPGVINPAGNKWDLSALSPEDAGQITFKWQYTFAEDAALNSDDTFSLGMPKNAEGKALIELKDTEASVALADEQGNTVGSYEIKDSTATVTLNEAAAESTKAVTGILELSGALNAEALKTGETTDATLAPQGETGEQWTLVLPGKAAAEPIPSAEPAPTTEPEQKKENPVMNGLKALFGVQKANETHNPNVTNETSDITLEIGYVEYVSPDGIPTRCPITKSGSDATVDMSKITYEPGGRFRIELDFNLLNLANIKENDYFEFYIPKEFSFSGTLDQKIDLMDGSDKIADYVVSKLDNNDDYAYLLKVTFAKIVDDPSVSGINGGVTFELGMNKDLGANASPHNIPLQIQGTAGPTTTIVTPGISHKIKGITKDAVYDKEKGTITWSIGVGTDSSCAGSDLGSVKVTDTLPDELKNTIESVWIGPAETGESVDVGAFKQAGNSYTFPDATSDKSYKAPQTLTIVTKVPDTIYDNLAADKSKDASKTFTNTAKMTSDSKFISFDGGDQEASKAVTIKRPGVVKEGVQKSSDIIAWMITINDTGSDPRNNIYRAVVTDTMSEDLIFRDTANSIDMASTISVTNKDTNAKVSFDEYTGVEAPNPDSDKKNYYQYNADTKQLVFYFYGPETIGDAYTIEFDTKINTKGMEHTDYDQNKPNAKLRNEADLTCSWPHGNGPGPGIQYGLGPIDTDFKAAYVTKEVTADESTGIMTWTIDPGTRLETLGNYTGDNAVITDTIEDNQTYQPNSLKVYASGVNIDSSKYAVIEPSGGNKELKITITDAETLKQLNAIKLSYQTKGNSFYSEPDSQVKTYHNRVDLKVTENSKNFSNYDDATAVFPNRFLNKNTKFVEENGELYMEYTITANENKMPLTSLTITDDFKNLKTTIKNNNDNRTENKTNIKDLWEFVDIKTSVSVNGGTATTGLNSITGASYSDNQFTYTPSNPSKSSYTIKLYLKMTEEAKKQYLGQYDSTIFTENKVTATGKSPNGDIDNYTVTSSGENEGKIENKLANKFSVENPDDMILSWAIDINPHAATMKTDSSQEMKIEDTIPAGLEFDLPSVKLYKIEGSNKTEENLNLNDIIVTADSEKKQTMTVLVPEDKTTYRLEYSTKIVGNVSGGNAQNNAVLSVGGNKVSSSSDQNDIARTAWAKLERLTTYQFKKYDAQAGETLPLVGAKFGLYSDENCKTLINYYESDEKGMVQFRGLENGKTYYYKEISAPEGYKSPDSSTPGTEIKIEQAGGVITGPAVSNERIVKSSEVNFTKAFNEKDNYSSATTDWISTFKLWLYPVAGNTSYKVPVELTGTDGNYQYSKADKDATATEIKNKADGSLKITGLPWGSYALEEVKAADGYAVPEGDAALQKFSIAEADGAVSYEGNQTITNTETNIHINKYLDNTTTRVDGAELSIHSGSAAGTVVRNPLTNEELKWTSDGNAWDITGLPAGTYWLVEDTAPTSNEQVGVAEPIQFELDIHGKIKNHSDNTITMKDMTNTIKVKKLDQFGKAVKGLAVDTLQLKVNNRVVSTNGNIDNDKYVKTTLDQNSGTFTFTGLKRGSTYVLEEATTPVNYLQANSITFTIKDDGSIDSTADTTKWNLNNEPNAPDESNWNFQNVYNGNNTLTLRDERIAGHVTFKKWDNNSTTDKIDDDKALPGVKFELYKKGASGGADIKITQDNSYFVSDANGDVTTVGSSLTNTDTGEPFSNGLLPGTYYFKEVETHGDFVMPEDDEAKSVEFTVSKDNRYTWKDIDGGEQAKNVIALKNDMYNTPLRTDILLHKTDAVAVDSNTGVIGATYGLYFDKACKNIVKGGPKGTTERKITTGKAGDVTTWTDTNGNSYEHTLQKNGEAYFCDVKRGTYWVKEISPAPGYTLSADTVEVVVGNEQGKTIERDVTNTQTEIKLKKVNSKNSALENARFTITPASGKTFADGTSVSKTLDAGEKASSLKGQLIAGNTYTVSETTLPAGYTKIDDFTIKVENNGNITVTGNRSDVTTDNKNDAKLLTIKDTETSFNFQKIDQFGDNVSSAALELYGTFANATSPISWNTSDNNAKTIAGELIAGNQYTLKETDTPDGYQTAPEVTFTVSADGKSLTVNTPTGDKRVALVDNSVTLKLTDRKIMGHAQLTKTDSADTSKKMEGVIFEIYKEGKPDQKIAELKTDKAGIVTTIGQTDTNPDTNRPLSDGLSIGKYYFIEKSTLNNYVLNTDKVEFTVNNNNDYYDSQGNAVTTKLIQNNKTNVLFDATVTLQKLDSTSNTGISNVAFTLSRKGSDNNYTPVAEPAELKTGADGKLSFNIHEKGSYKLTETVPAGYTDSSKFEATFDLTDTCHGQTLEIKESSANKTLFNLQKTAGDWNDTGVLNVREKGSVTVQKVNENLENLSGAEFTLYQKTGDTHTDADKIIGKDKTDNNGKIVFDNLEWGEYWLLETKPPVGYQLPEPNNAKKVIIEAASLRPAFTSVDAIQNTQSSLVVKKQSREGAALYGATLEVYDSSGQLVSNAIHTSGDTWELTGILTADADYYIKEASVPEGYETPESTNEKGYLAKIHMDISGNISLTETYTAAGIVAVSEHNVIVKNEPIEVSLNKADNNGQPLTGAAFKVTGDFAGGTDEIEVINNNSEVLYAKLVPGREYTITETQAPDGYKKLPTDVKFKVNTAGAVSLINEEEVKNFASVQADGTVFDIVLKDDPVNVGFVKTSGDGTPIAGAELKIAGVFSDTLQTEKAVTSNATDAVKVSGLIVGKEYTLTETKPAYGYQLAEQTVKFKVQNDGTIQFTENPDSIAGLKDNDENITFKNEAITASVKKTDEKGQPLPGVTFDLKGKFADNPETSKQITSDNGNYSLDAQLIAGESYTLKETAAPQAYQISATEIKFTVSADGKTLSLDENYDGVSLENNVITIQNTLKLGDILFTKKAVNDTDDTVQTPRDGVTFGLYSDLECTKPVVAKNAEGSDVNVTAVSDKDGTVRFKDMPVGVYYIKEMAVANDVTQYYKANTTVYKANIDGTKTANTGEAYGITLADNTAIDNTIVNTAIRGSITLKKIDGEYKDADGNSIPLNGAEFAICLKNKNTDGKTVVVASIVQASAGSEDYVIKPADSISLGEGYTSEDANDFGIPYLYQNKLLAGQYDIFEVTAPVGYEKPETAVAELHITETASDVTQGSETNSVITNVTKKQDIAVQKLVEVRDDSELQEHHDATESKAGFTFKLERKAEVDGTTPVFGYTDIVTTAGEKGKATFNNVPVGTYKVTEISTTETDYVVSDNYTQEIVVDNNGNVSYGENKTSMVFENSLKRGSITGAKVDVSSHVEGKPGVAGAVIGLYENADDAVNAALATATTGTGGNYTFDNIPYGTYYIKEKAVPENSDYLLNETQKIEVTVNDKNLNEGKVRVTDKITNTLPTGSFTIEKTDAITGTALAGVTFKLEGKTSDNHAITAIENKKTDSDGKVTFDNIPVGKYTLTETASIANYQTPTETAKWEVELIKDNKETVETKIADITKEDGAFQITNNPIEGSIRFTKMDTDGRTLAGIGFTLTRDGDLIDTDKKTFKATSGADGVVSFTGIPYGDYQLTEDKTVGVKTTMESVAIEAKDLKVAADGQSFACAVNSGVVENELVKVSISLTKVDQNGAALAGVAFDVTRMGKSGNEGFELNPTGNADYTVYAAKSRVISDEHGVVRLNNLPMGSYQLTENFKASSIVDSIATGQKPITVAFTIDAAGQANITPQEGIVYQENNTWKIKNFLKSGTLQIDKIFGDQDSAENTENTARPNAEFDIFADSNDDGQPDGDAVMTLTTNEKGQFVSNDDGSYTQDGSRNQWLLEGNYLLKETASGSEDYMTDPDYHRFAIAENTVASVKTEGSKIINNPYRGTLEITKFDEKYTIDGDGNLVLAENNNNTQLNGAVFAVCLKDTKKIVTTLTPRAGETGVYVLPETSQDTDLTGYEPVAANALGVPYLKNGQLLKGDYIIVEVTPPTGYEDKQTTKDITIGTGENADIVDKIANVLIEKPFAITKLAETADAQKITESGEFKAAAKDAFAFTLTRDAGQTPEFAYTRTVKTDENGIADFKEIPYGTYSLAETETPDSHIPAVLGTLKVDTDGVHYTADNKTETTDNLSVNNSLKRGSITGKKIDNTTAPNIEHGVSGAVMGLFTKDGETKLAEAETAKDGSYRFDSIPYGDYQIREITAPEGYYLSLETAAAEIRDNGGNVTADVIHDAMIKGNFTLIKKDAEGEYAPLAGAAFTLKGTNFYGDTVNTTVTTGENGEAVFNDIPLGSYTLTESTQPENFTQFTPQSYSVAVVRENDNTAKTTLTPEDSDKALKPDRDSTYSITNERNKGNIVFNKVGITGEQDDPGKPLSGAKFGLYRDAKCSIVVFGEDNKPRTAVSDERGTLTFKDVSFGEYYVKEIGHVINYLPGAKAYKAVVNGDGSFNGLEDTTDNIVTNERNKGSVTLTKVDSEDSSFKLDGAEFTVYQNDKPVKTGITGDDGILQIDGLLLGQEYRITETKAPVGHQLPDPENLANSKTFTLADDQATESETAAQVKLDLGNWENEPNQGDIIFTKYGTNDENNKDSKAVLPGAMFGLYKDLNTTQEVQQATSSPDGTVIFEDIYVGNYYVKEISTPANYQADETIYQAIIKEDGSFDGLYPMENNVMGSQKTDTVVNEAVRGSVTIDKTDSIDHKPLEGVEFTLTKKDSTGKDIEVQKAKTDSDGKLTFSHLLMDTQYTVTETATLNSYILSTRQESMTLKDTDAERDRTINWTNTPTELTFKKVDTTGAGLKGAVFTLYDGGKEKTTATSAEDGTVIFRYLEKGKTYTVKETSRPGEDYLINTTEFKAVVNKDGTCTLKDNDQTVTEVVNADAGVITLTKTGDGGNVLAGAVFDLKNDKGEVIQTQTTAENGQLMFKDVPMGSYTIVETAAPDTYQVSADVTQVTLSRGAGQKAEISRENTLSQVIFHKRGVITETCAGDRQHAPLEGAEYGLYSSPDCAGEAAYTATSSNPGDGCKVIFTGVARGIWYVKEMSAPQNYLIDQTIYKAVVDNNGHYESLTNLDGTEVADNRVIDDAVTTDIVLKKVNEQNPEEILPGSTYGLFKKAAKAVPAEAKAFSFFRTALAAEEDNDEWQEVARATTDDKGYLRFEGVLMGVEYTVRELIAPEGSHVSEKPVTIKFKINDQTGKVVVESIDLGLADPDDPNSAPTAAIDPETGEIVWLEPSIVAEISKVDVNQNLLTGAKLRITVKDESGAYVPLTQDGKPVEWVSGDKAEEFIKLMKLGEDYRLEEIEAPSGYTLAAPMNFKVTSPEQGVGPGQNHVDQFVMTDTLTSFYISKTIINSTDELPGAVLTVYNTAGDGSIARDEAGNEVVAQTITGESLSWTSGTEMKKIEGLKTGTYVLRETTAPDGYEVAEEITFTLMPDGTVTVGGEACEGNIVRMQDKPAPETPGVTMPQQPGTPDAPESSAGAATGIFGSQSGLWGFMALLAVAVLAICGTVVFRKKHR